MPAEGRGLGSRSASYVTDIQEIGVSLLPPITVGKLQTALHTKAKNSPDYRFYALDDKLYRRDILEWALVRCRNNRWAPGVDGQSFADIEKYGQNPVAGRTDHGRTLGCQRLADQAANY